MRVAADSHRRGSSASTRFVRREGIDCDFSRLDGYLFPRDGDKPATLDRELDAAHRAGLQDVERSIVPVRVEHGTGVALPRRASSIR